MTLPCLSSAHILALLPDALRSQIFRAAYIAANNPHWSFAPSHFLPSFREMWTRALEVSKKEGYLRRDGSVFAITLPAGPAIEWLSAMLADDSRYFAGNPNLVSRYTSWQPKNEIISLVFKDDLTIMSQEEPVPMDAWCDVFTNARITRVLVSPEEYGWTEIGHVGMFREGHEGLWKLIGHIAVDGKLPDKGKIRRWNQGESKL
jgi:hypothetical protein